MSHHIMREKNQMKREKTPWKVVVTQAHGNMDFRLQFSLILSLYDLN